MPPEGVHTPTEAEMAERISAKLREYNANPAHPDLIGRPDGNPVQLRPPFPGADQLNQRWAEGVQRNADRWVAGVQNPRANFKDRAIRQKGAWQQGVQAAIREDRFAKGMQNVDVDAAIEIATAVGAAGYAQGALVRQDKHRRKMEKVAPMMAAVVSDVRNMPAETPEQREQRAVAQIRGARAVGTKLRGGT